MGMQDPGSPPSSLLWTRPEHKPTKNGAKNGATGPEDLDTLGGPQATAVQQRPLEVMQGQIEQAKFQQATGERQSKQVAPMTTETNSTHTLLHRAPLS